ncbi:hypothetical protein BJV78DRAFT_1175301 [Lactifluus subvellereus]|nr:hypothetical protein BJV78DRAFT_1175301 [Lactifluus subvellereus]
MQKQTPRTRPLQAVNLESLVLDDRASAITLRSGPTRDAFVPDENAPSIASKRVIPPPILPLPAVPSTKVMEPPRFQDPPQRPSTPPKCVGAPDLTRFLSPSRDPPRPSKPISRTRIALATDLWTEGGRADLLGLALEQHGVQHATPMEKAVRRGLQVSPRKVGIDKEIRYVRGGLAEKASQAIGKKNTALSLWRKSIPLPESARMLLQIEQILSAPKHPPQRGGRDDGSLLILFSVPPHDAKSVPITAFGVGRGVAMWEPLVEVDISGMASGVYLCSRFVLV